MTENFAEPAATAIAARDPAFMIFDGALSMRIINSLKPDKLQLGTVQVHCEFAPKSM